MKKIYFSFFFRKAGLVFLLSFLTAMAYAQQTVRGTVVDPKGEALTGVSVLVKGTTRGSATDASGKYQIDADANSTLLFSFVGYADREVIVGNQKEINVSLEQGT